MYRLREGVLEVLLVHPGGPFWANRDLGGWTIPKGEIGPDEEPLVAAQREFAEETGGTSHGPFIPLTAIRQRAGKTVHAWAFEGDFDPALLRSNKFTVEWPPRSGQQREFPETDRAGWFTLEAAREKLLPAQLPLVEELAVLIQRAR